MLITPMPVFTTKNVQNVRGKKILFANFPADGHFNPLTGLAAHLKNKGNDVRWYSSSAYSKKLEEMAIPWYPFQKAMEFEKSDFEAVFPGREKAKGPVKKLIFDIIHLFILRSPEFYEDIVEIHKTFDFDIVVCDVMFTGIPFIADKMKVPVVSIGVVPITETSVDLPPTGLGLTPSYTRLGKMKQAAMRWFTTKVIFKKPEAVLRNLLNDHGVTMDGKNMFDLIIKKSSLVLQIGSPGFEFKRSDLSSNIRFAGALLPYRTPRKKSGWYHEKLGRYQKIVLATQGTVEKDCNKLLVPVLEAFKNSDHLVVITTGGTDTDKLRKQYAADNVIIEDFIPFDDIMPYADVYITNGGYGGVMLSIMHELPMVVAGVLEGKNEINARVGYFKLGVNLKTETPAPQQIRVAVDRVIIDRVYSDRVKTLSAELNQYDSYAICEKSIADILAKNVLIDPVVYNEEIVNN